MKIPYDVRKMLLDRAFAEMDRLGVPFEEQYNWLKSKNADCLLPTLAGGASLTYAVYNSALATTAAPIKQPTGTAVRTMMQLRSGVGSYCRPIAWGCSFDASSAGTPGQVELFETTVAATMTTAYLNADIQPYGNANAPANGTVANQPIDVTSTSTSGFATAAVTEGTVANYRMADLQMIAPTNQYVYNWPLGREFDWKAQNYLRVRMTFPVSVNAWIYLIFET